MKRWRRWVQLRQRQEETTHAALEKAQAECARRARVVEALEAELRAASATGPLPITWLQLEERTRDGLRARLLAARESLRQALDVQRTAALARQEAWRKCELAKRALARKEEELRKRLDRAEQRAMDESASQRHSRQHASGASRSKTDG